MFLHISVYVSGYTTEDINCNQHSFVNSKSILGNIWERIDIKIEYLMKGDNIIYLDYRKAFDTVFHYRENLKKLRYF